MNQLPTEYRRIILESAFAGVNHGLHREVRSILPALPLLVPDSALRTLCMAILLAGMNDNFQATELLRTCIHPDVDKVRAMLFSEQDE